MAAATSPALPAFSYAQAAKGLAPAPSTAQSQAEPSVNNPDMLSTERTASTPEPEKLDSLNVTAGVVKDNEISNGLISKMVHDDVKTGSTTKSTSDSSGSTSNIKQTSSSLSGSKEVSESTSPSLVASVTTLPREDEISSTQNGSSESWDKQSQNSALAERPVQIADNGKTHNADDDWVSVSAPKAEKELKAAPIPAVNIWQQRKEAQAAKAKADAALRSSTVSAAPNKPKPQSQPTRHVEAQGDNDETKRKSSAKLTEKGDGNSKKKQFDDPKGRDDGKRLAHPGRASEPDKENTEFSTAPPSVGDASSWPTPDTVLHDERKKSQAQDKADSKSPGMKPNQKWVPVPYVPTAKFNTPLPSTMSRRGGRPIRGSRDSGNRGGHVPQGQGNIGEKTEKTKPMGPPPVPKQASEQQRGRVHEALAGNRATSAPTQGRRAASVGPAFPDHRRSTQIDVSDGTTFQDKKQVAGGSQDPSAAPGPVENEEGATSTKSKPDSRSTAHQSSLSYRAGTYDSARHVSGESHAHPRSYAGTERRNTYVEFDRQTEVSGRRERRESNKDYPRTRDFDFKTESWRDREHTGERTEQQRNGRGRGGYRGRGTHSPYTPSQSNQTHAFTAPLPQQPFSGGKTHTLGERHRQSSAPYAGNPPQPNHRSASRSQSIATHGLYPGAPNNFSTALSPIQTDISGMIGGYPTMYPGIMSAMPYDAALEPMALISMVAAQLEYYFSIENLCKDMYLRSHMDSQGWVPLSVIAGFNRIKSLTEDMGLIRHVCQVSRNIEFRPGDDGNDRLRKPEKWEQWVLDMDQRQAHARNEGPPPLQELQSPSQLTSTFSSMSQMTSPTWAPGPFYDGYAEAPSYNVAASPSGNQDTSTPSPSNVPDLPVSEDFSLMNGQAELTHRHSTDVPDTSNSAVLAQTFYPGGPSRVNTDIPTTNGYAPASPQEIGIENVFSNERMNELHVCVRHPTPQYQPSFISPAARTFSHGSIDYQTPVSAQLANPLPSLRGGAGSPKGLDSSPHQSASIEHSAGNNDGGVFWMKDGTPPDTWNQEGSTSEKYQSLHDRALAERSPGIITDDMEWLYQFWSHFLVRNFNSDMYKDFRTVAWEDAAAGQDGGLNHLSQYYGALLSGQRVLTKELARDIVQLAEADLEHKRQMFYKLRSAIRDGAFNMKSRIMIEKFLTPQFKDELER